MGTQAKFYQVTKGKLQKAINQLEQDEDYYDVLNNQELVISKIDIDTSWNNLPQLISKLSSNELLSNLAVFGREIKSKYNYECPIKYVDNMEVVSIENILTANKIYSEEEFIVKFNETQGAPYDEIQYKDMLNGIWNHYNTFVEFYSNCKLSKSSILILIS